MPTKPLSKPLLFIGVLCLFFFPNCRKSDVANTEAGRLLITVDDWNVDNWNTYIDSFDKYGLNLTFYVSHFHQMDDRKVKILHELRSRGHEVAYHTLNHPNAKDYCRDNGLDQFIANEIATGQQLFYQKGIPLHSFAFPYGQYTDELKDTMSTLFRSVRCMNYGFFQFNSMIDSKYALNPEDRFFESFGMDKAYAFDQKSWDHLVVKVKEGRDIALLFHSIGEAGEFSMRLEDFQYMGNSIRENKIQCLTVSDYFD